MGLRTSIVSEFLERNHLTEDPHTYTKIGQLSKIKPAVQDKFSWPVHPGSYVVSKFPPWLTRAQ